MRRILIIGTSGSGKSTLAMKLGNIFQIPNYDLDDYYWLPNWQPNPEHLEKILHSILSKDKWIISGNYSKYQTMINEKADTIIWLDYSFVRCFYWGFKRSLMRMLKKKSCCNGNFETMRRTFFSRDSLLLWISTTYRRRKTSYNQLFRHKDFSKSYFRFKSPKELETGLEIWKKE